MIKILIIGKRSFIGSHLYFFLKKKFSIKLLSFSDLIKKKENFLKRYTHIINCSINPNYVNYKI